MNKKPVIEKPRSCYFCLHNINEIDYKHAESLRRFTSSYGKIVPRRKSGVCTAHQRNLAISIKRARFMALLPYTAR
jgi:small subunit ribosomal protein S18